MGFPPGPMGAPGPFFSKLPRGPNEPSPGEKYLVQIHPRKSFLVGFPFRPKKGTGVETPKGQFLFWPQTGFFFPRVPPVNRELRAQIVLNKLVSNPKINFPTFTNPPGPFLKTPTLFSKPRGLKKRILVMGFRGFWPGNSNFSGPGPQPNPG